jgi:hypothetical protein
LPQFRATWLKIRQVHIRTVWGQKGDHYQNSYSYSFQNSESADIKALLAIHIKDFPKSSRTGTRSHMSLEFSADEVVGIGVYQTDNHLD